MSAMNGVGLVDEKWRSGLAAWRASLLHEMTLPKSGLQVQLKHVGLEDLLISGDIPDALSGLVADAVEGREFKMDASNLGLLTDMFNVVVRACMVNPPVADVPDENHLGINELSFADKQAIFDWANGDAKALAPFRPKQSGSVSAAAPVGQDIQPTAVPDSGDSEQLGGVPI